MARLIIDFENSSIATRYPAHGWALNSQDVRLLWLPVCRTLHSAESVRAAHGFSDKFTHCQWLERRAFDNTLKKLAITLREISRYARQAKLPPMYAKSQDDFNVGHEAYALLPLFFDLAFIYLRRLADDFTRTSRFVLFRHVNSAPQKFKILRKNAKANKLNDLLVDPRRVSAVIRDYSEWFDLLNERPSDTMAQERGIRSAIEHHPVSISVQYSKTGDNPWCLEAMLGTPIQKDFRRDLSDVLKKIIGDVCTFWTKMCEVINAHDGYELWGCPYGDQFGGIIGDDSDITDFWPQLEHNTV